VFLKVQPVAVTGIRQELAPSIKVAEYIWSTEWNMIEAPLKNCFTLPPVPAEKWIGNGEAIFQQYDDGWRLTSITGAPDDK
jgi:hypothetical protein